ncbi:MAG TPA: ornithine cyclodeaminase [Anaerolineae bacterium]|nr:ornithine cyclodeaminase [Anaerolineae bacterium]HID84624.1 ornithine cyclodeaminase [Anaerolineales bacterium]HIQ09294.1 ornithine cyclodeaminase [Anaerolineaceae bacterium]
MLVLRATDVLRALPMAEAIEAVKRAYQALSAEEAEVPLRLSLPVAPHEGVSLFMPAYVHTSQEEALAVKVVSVFPHNVERGLPLIHAAVLVLEANSGRPLALLEGGALTAIRTGAASGAATDVLARPDSRVLAVFGAGAQGRTQIEAVCTVRPIERVWLFDLDRACAEALAADVAGKGPVPQDVRVAASPREAVAEADVICTATTSRRPVFADEDLKPGVHINGIGAYTPEMAEVPPETVARALVVVDSRQAALAEAGDLIQPLRAGRITEAHIHAELGEILLGRKPGRTSPEQITFFKSVGVAVQDALTARVALRNALEEGLGQRVTW